MRPIQFHAKTADDLTEAVNWYNGLRAGLGDELRSEVYAAIERVRLHPLRHAVIEQGIRRSFVHRFPYSVLFRLVDDTAVRILVIRHHRQREGFGLGRR